eukprot:2493765-Lingulodinium_polyedra.AAC.1
MHLYSCNPATHVPQWEAAIINMLHSLGWDRTTFGRQANAQLRGNACRCAYATAVVCKCVKKDGGRDGKC